MLASCNWVYGLDATTLGVDTDEDGIIDGVDNCPTIKNPDQLDSNLVDEGGDACAQCPNLIGLDIDEDLYDDGCDRCLGPGPNGADDDEDGLDDGCDPCMAGTSQFPIDFNQNGVGDGCEVCFEVPQGDADQDGLDDACDRCQAGPPHDEDGDGVDDACDNCPLDPNPDQALNPSGSAGAACARSIQKCVRTFFDPFLVRDNFRWTGVFGAWTQLTDRTALVANGGRSIAASFDGEFRLVLRVRLTAADSQVRVTQTAGGTGQECSVTRAGAVMLGIDAASIPVGDEPITIEMYQYDADILPVTRCQVTSQGQSVQVSGDMLVGSSRIGIFATNLELHAVDLVTAPPKAPI